MELKQIKRVWIAPGCLVCDACESECPEVFEVREEDCVIRKDAKTYLKSHREQIIQACESCCVDTVKIEYEDGSIHGENRPS